MNFRRVLRGASTAVVLVLGAMLAGCGGTPPPDPSVRTGDPAQMGAEQQKQYEQHMKDKMRGTAGAGGPVGPGVGGGSAPAGPGEGGGAPGASGGPTGPGAGGGG